MPIVGDFPVTRSGYSPQRRDHLPGWSSVPSASFGAGINDADMVECACVVLG
jgi:hypothetical protein